MAVCEDTIAGFLESNPAYDFAAFIEPSGVVECTTTELPDAEAEDQIAGLIAARGRKIDINYFVGSGTDIADTVYQPIFKEQTFAGFFALSVPDSRSPDLESSTIGPAMVVNFTTDGKLLRPGDLDESERAAMPGDRSLAALSSSDPQVFSALDMNGVSRTYSTAKAAAPPWASLRLG